MAKGELRHLTIAERRALRAFIAALRKQYSSQVVDVRLFGSKARGEGGPESDLDLLVVVAGDERQMGADIARLGSRIDLKYGVVLSDITMSVERFEWHRRHQAPLYKNLMREGIELWTRTPAP